jgi:hypothetical protein
MSLKIEVTDWYIGNQCVINACQVIMKKQAAGNSKSTQYCRSARTVVKV